MLTTYQPIFSFFWRQKRANVKHYFKHMCIFLPFCIYRVCSCCICWRDIRNQNRNRGTVRVGLIIPPRNPNNHHNRWCASVANSPLPWMQLCLRCCPPYPNTNTQHLRRIGQQGRECANTYIERLNRHGNPATLVVLSYVLITVKTPHILHFPHL